MSELDRTFKLPVFIILKRDHCFRTIQKRVSGTAFDKVGNMNSVDYTEIPEVFFVPLLMDVLSDSLYGH
jgi:hypothetical protein